MGSPPPLRPQNIRIRGALPRSRPPGTRLPLWEVRGRGRASTWGSASGPGERGGGAEGNRTPSTPRLRLGTKGNPPCLLGGRCPLTPRASGHSAPPIEVRGRDGAAPRRAPCVREREVVEPRGIEPLRRLAYGSGRRGTPPCLLGGRCPPTPRASGHSAPPIEVRGRDGAAPRKAPCVREREVVEPRGIEPLTS